MNENRELVKLNLLSSLVIAPGSRVGCLGTPPEIEAALVQAGAVVITAASLESLPFEDASLAAVVIWESVRYLPEVSLFLAEANRVLSAGGRLAVFDTLVPDKYKVARYCNAFEQLADPAHHRVYSLREWKELLPPGLSLCATERFPFRYLVGLWASGLGRDEATLLRLRAMLLQAPAPVRDWYQVTAEPGWSSLADIPFTRKAILLTACK